jgi:hypothetical protein
VLFLRDLILPNLVLDLLDQQDKPVFVPCSTIEGKPNKAIDINHYECRKLNSETKKAGLSLTGVDMKLSSAIQKYYLGIVTKFHQIDPLPATLRDSPE